MIERSSQGREFHNDGAATANSRSSSVALDFTDGIARSRVLEPLRLQHDVFILINDRRYWGARPCNALNVRRSTLELMRALIGNQYKSRIIGVMWQNLGALHTSLAEACGTLWIFANWLFVSPYNRQCSLRVVHRKSTWFKKLE